MAICRILQFQRVDLSGIREDSFSKGRLLLVVRDLQGSLVSLVKVVVCRVEVVILVEVVVDGSIPRGVSTIFLYKMLRIIQT